MQRVGSGKGKLYDSTFDSYSVFCFISVSALFGQADSGTIVGTVTDQAGAVVPGAKVTLTHEATKLSRTLSTNANGQYVANAFPTGAITATVEHPGFEQLVRSGLVLTAADILRVDLQLAVGSTQQSVEVIGEGTLLQSRPPRFLRSSTTSR